MDDDDRIEDGGGEDNVQRVQFDPRKQLSNGEPRTFKRYDPRAARKEREAEERERLARHVAAATRARAVVSAELKRRMTAPRGGDREVIYIVATWVELARDRVVEGLLLDNPDWEKSAHGPLLVRLQEAFPTHGEKLKRLELPLRRWVNELAKEWLDQRERELNGEPQKRPKRTVAGVVRKIVGEAGLVYATSDGQLRTLIRDALRDRARRLPQKG